MAEQKFWFKAKRYGWGWMPITWQGWLSVLVFTLSMILGAVLLLDDRNVSNQQFILYFVWTFVTVFVLLLVSYKKGPPPRWRWGGNDESE